MNNSFIEVDARRLTDGSSLIRFHGESFVTYMKEDVTHFRVVVGGRTCIFEKENDPSICHTTSTGKLLQYLVPDGAHVQAGDPMPGEGPWDPIGFSKLHENIQGSEHAGVVPSQQWMREAEIKHGICAELTSSTDLQRDKRRSTS